MYNQNKSNSTQQRNRENVSQKNCFHLEAEFHRTDCTGGPEGVERPAASTCPPCCHTLIMKRAQVKQYLIVIYINIRSDLLVLITRFFYNSTAMSSKFIATCRDRCQNSQDQLSPFSLTTHSLTILCHYLLRSCVSQVSYQIICYLTTWCSSR